MKQRLIIMDTCDVVFKRLSDGKIVASTETQLASIAQSVNEEKIFGGIGSGTVAILSSQKEMELTVRDALWTMDYLEMSQGVTIDPAGTAKITKSEKVKLNTKKATLTDKTIAGPVTVIDATGKQSKLPAVLGVVTLTDGVDGDEVTVFYEAPVIGDMVTFDAEKFSEKYSVEYKTIAYDPTDNSVFADIYIQFDEAKPSGAFDMSFEMGSAITPELNFSVTKPVGKSALGRIIFVERK